MKTKEELNEIKEEIEKLDKKLRELTEEELEQVTGGVKAHVVGGAVALYSTLFACPGGVDPEQTNRADLSHPRGAGTACKQ